MDSVENDGPPAKASRQQAKAGSHEFCQGYVDQNGIWNNGFYCRRWGGPDENYCCGGRGERYCCPEQTTVSTQASLTPSAVNFIPVAVGLSAVLVLVLVVLLVCFFCPSCPGYKRKRRSKPPRQIIVGRSLSVSMEAEATSAVIAAQALVPLQAASCSSPGHGSMATDDGHLHCGCRWSPSDSSTTMVDVDSIVTSMYQNTTLPWQPELDNFYNYSCEVRPNCKDSHRGYDGNQQQQPCNRTAAASSRFNSSHRMLAHSRQSPLGIKAFRSNSSGTRESSDESKQATLEKDPQLATLRRTYALPDPGRLPGKSVKEPAPTAAVVPASSLLDPERQRRDSGVLVEDQDTTGSGNSMLALNIPAIELTSIGRSLAYNSIDRRNKPALTQAALNNPRQEQ